MKVVETSLPGVRLIEPKVFGDSRGFFFESYNQERYAALGIATTFVQDNVSLSVRGTLRGLHLQNPDGQGKLVSVLEGEVYDVAVDVRRGSPTFGKWCAAVLSGENKRQLYIPEGFAHGFCVTSERALFMYKCTALYHPESEQGVLYNDPELGIDWPVAKPILSEKDTRYPRLSAIDVERLPPYATSRG